MQTKSTRTIEKGRCPERQENSIRVPDFECKLEAGGHNVHVDPRTGLRWGLRGIPGCLKKKK